MKISTFWSFIWSSTKLSQLFLLAALMALTLNFLNGYTLIVPTWILNEKQAWPFSLNDVMAAISRGAWPSQSIPQLVQSCLPIKGWQLRHYPHWWPWPENKHEMWLRADQEVISKLKDLPSSTYHIAKASPLPNTTYYSSAHFNIWHNWISASSCNIFDGPHAQESH